MPQRLANKVAIVTGASRGIGAAIARRLGADGAKVVINYAASAEQAERVASEIRYAGGQAVTAKADLSDPAQIPELFETARLAYGRLDILVNNAGTAILSQPLEQVDIGQYATQFDLNVRGLILTTQAALAAIGDDGGRIINITSGITRSPSAGSSLYSATKAAVEMLTKCWAKELGSRGITVNAVAPGTTDTDLLRSSMTPELATMLVQATPLGRLGRPEDIADVVAFIASEESRWITGEIIGATGGL
jgi:3-oxoacyl-[acyl-carrier protein] reductase